MSKTECMENLNKLNLNNRTRLGEEKCYNTARDFQNISTSTYIILFFLCVFLLVIVSI